MIKSKFSFAGTHLNALNTNNIEMTELTDRSSKLKETEQLKDELYEALLEKDIQIFLLLIETAQKGLSS